MANPERSSLPSGPAYQRLFLRITLWTLVAGAIVGAALLLTGLYSIGGRVVGTCFASAAAAALMMSVGTWLDDSKRRRAGMVGTCVVLASFLLALTAIWIDAFGPVPQVWQWRLLVSSLLTLTYGGACAALLATARMPEMRWPARVGFPLGVLCCLLAMLSVWSGTFGVLGILVVTLTCGWPCVTLALINLTLDQRHWRWIGVAAVAVLWFDAISVYAGNGSLIASHIAYFWAAAISTAAINLFLTLRIPPWAAFLRWSAILCTLLACLMAAAYNPSFQRWLDSDAFVVRLIAALALLGGCSAVALAIAMRFESTKRWTATAEPYRTLTVSCPRCAKRQSITLPESPCINCALTFRITMHDPRCAACGYDTAGLTAPTCPECGNPVLLKSAWQSAPLAVATNQS